MASAGSEQPAYRTVRNRRFTARGQLLQHTDPDFTDFWPQNNLHSGNIFGLHTIRLPVNRPKLIGDKCKAKPHNPLTASGAVENNKPLLLSQ